MYVPVPGGSVPGVDDELVRRLPGTRTGTGTEKSIVQENAFFTPGLGLPTLESLTAFLWRQCVTKPNKPAKTCLSKILPIVL